MKSLSATSAGPTAGGCRRVEVYLVCLVELVLHRCLAALAHLLGRDRPALILSRIVWEQRMGLSLLVVMLRFWIGFFLKSKGGHYSGLWSVRRVDLVIALNGWIYFTCAYLLVQSAHQRYGIVFFILKEVILLRYISLGQLFTGTFEILSWILRFPLLEWLLK